MGSQLVGNKGKIKLVTRQVTKWKGFWVTHSRTKASLSTGTFTVHKEVTMAKLYSINKILRKRMTQSIRDNVVCKTAPCFARSANYSIFNKERRNKYLAIKIANSHQKNNPLFQIRVHCTE